MRAIFLSLLLAAPLFAAPEISEALKKADGILSAGDIQKAAELFEIEAGKDDPIAHFRLGEIYLRGAKGIVVDQDRSFFHLQSAAEAGLPEASALLGDISKSKAEAADAKPDREHHFEEARLHFEKAAKKNHSASQLALARLLESGSGGKPDPARALDFLKKSALSGNAEAMNELGLRYQQGKGVSKDPVTALGWLLAGAERGNPAAMTNLGICYARGIALPANPGKAGSWYAQASKLGYAPAQYLLGEVFEKGLGTQPNPAFAFVNYTRAAKANHPRAIQALTTLTLTPEQKEEAEKLLLKKP